MIRKVFLADSVCVHRKPDKRKAIFLSVIFLWSIRCDTIKSVPKSCISCDKYIGDSFQILVYFRSHTFVWWLFFIKKNRGLEIFFTKMKHVYSHRQQSFLVSFVGKNFSETKGSLCNDKNDASSSLGMWLSGSRLAWYVWGPGFKPMHGTK